MIYKSIFYIVIYVVIFISVYQIYLDITHFKRVIAPPFEIKQSLELELRSPDPYVQEFLDHDIVHIPNFLDESLFKQIFKECSSITSTSSMRTHEALSAFRKGETIGANAIDQHRLMMTLSLYYHPALIQFLSSVFMCPDLTFVGLDDLSRYTLLFYNQPQDGITWHVDGNHYMGRRFTIIIVLENSGNEQTNKSCAKFQFIDKKTQQLVSIQTSPNDFIAFDSSTLFHKATEMCPGDSRLLLSFTYVNNLRRAAPGMIANFVKSKVMKYS